MDKVYVDQVYQGTLTMEEVTIATIPEDSTFIMKGFFVSNNNDEGRYFTLKIGTGTRLASEHVVPPKDTTLRDNLHIPITVGEEITIQGEVENDLDYYIWGIVESE